MPVIIDGLTFGGDCTWQPSGEPERFDRVQSEPQLSEPWLGRADLLPAFLAAHPIGMAYLGGYIVERRPRNHSPGMMECDLVVALPPDFTAVTPVTNPVTRTSQSSALVAGTIGEDGRFTAGGAKLQAEMSVTYETVETQYTYFSQRAPEGPRHSQVASAKVPRVIRSSITARDGSREASFTGFTAPTSIVAALFMPVVDKVVGPTADPILGTPWFRCQETVTRELEGTVS